MFLQSGDSCKRYGYNLTECEINADACLSQNETSVVDCDYGFVYSDEYYQETTVSQVGPITLCVFMRATFIDAIKLCLVRFSLWSKLTRRCGQLNVFCWYVSRLGINWSNAGLVSVL